MDWDQSRMSSSIARDGKGDAVPPTLACRQKYRIRKILRFSTSETVFCTEIDSKND